MDSPDRLEVCGEAWQRCPYMKYENTYSSLHRVAHSLVNVNNTWLVVAAGPKCWYAGHDVIAMAAVAFGIRYFGSLISWRSQRRARRLPTDE